MRRLHLGLLRLFSPHARHVLHVHQLPFALPRKFVRLVHLVQHARLVQPRLNRLKRIATNPTPWNLPRFLSISGAGYLVVVAKREKQATGLYEIREGGTRLRPG